MGSTPSVPIHLLFFGMWGLNIILKQQMVLDGTSSFPPNKVSVSDPVVVWSRRMV